MMRTYRPGLAMLAASASIVLLSSCGQEAAPGDEPGGGGTTPSATSSSTSAPTSPAVTSAPQSVVDQSITLLAKQVEVAPDQIEVVRSIEIDWRDGSIGCAKKDTGYIQVITPGSLVELAVDGTTYAFHAAEGEPPFYCADPTEPLDEQ